MKARISSNDTASIGDLDRRELKIAGLKFQTGGVIFFSWEGCLHANICLNSISVKQGCFHSIGSKRDPFLSAY